MSKEPRSLREAIAAQVLEEVDALVSRVEALQKASDAESQLKTTIAALNDASDRYRLAVTEFTEQAKTELTEHMQRKAADLVPATLEQLRGAMQEAARGAFDARAVEKVEGLADKLREAAGEFRRSVWTRIIENFAVAVVASGITAAVVYAFVR
jgi:N-methylhydantoinase B/oxoprolinase/acetone carboxylase alpha subunit